MVKSPNYNNYFLFVNKFSILQNDFWNVKWWHNGIFFEVFQKNEILKKAASERWYMDNMSF